MGICLVVVIGGIATAASVIVTVSVKPLYPFLAHTLDTCNLYQLVLDFPESRESLDVTQSIIPVMFITCKVPGLCFSMLMRIFKVA